MDDVREGLLELAAEKATYSARRFELVERARALNITWREIASLLGVTEKAAQITHWKVSKG